MVSFSFVSTVSTIYSSDTNSMIQRIDIVFPIYQIMIVLSTFFVFYPVWPKTVKIKVIEGIVWNISLIYMLAFCSTLVLLLCQFEKLQLIIFTLNLIVIFILTNWKVAIVMLTLGSICAVKVYEYYMGINTLNTVFPDIYFYLLYVLLLASTILITILKPK